MSQYFELGSALGQWLRQQLATSDQPGLMTPADKQWLDTLRTQPAPLSWSAIKAEYQALSITELPQRLAEDPDFATAVTLLLSTGQMVDRLLPVPLLPVLSSSDSWSASNAPVAGSLGASSYYSTSLPRKSRDSNIGAGWVPAYSEPTNGWLYAQFVSPVQVKRLHLYVSGSTFSPTSVAIECAHSLGGPWATVCTLPVQQVTSEQIFAVPAYTAHTCWRLRILANAGNQPGIFEWQLDGLPV